MFEHWPEDRRRWFLVTFCAFWWLLFANSLACLGDQFAGGGIGPDAAHAAGIVGSVAGVVVLWAMFRLRMTDWLFAFLFGLSLNAAAVDSGLRDHAAAGIWAIACDYGDAGACINLAGYYDRGESVLGGALDAVRLQRRACELEQLGARCRHAGISRQ